METIFINIGFLKEEISNLLIQYKEINEFNFIKIFNLLTKYNCHKDYIKEAIINRSDLFNYDADKLEYLLIAIKSNNDSIEDILLELI